MFKAPNKTPFAFQRRFYERQRRHRSVKGRSCRKAGRVSTLEVHFASKRTVSVHQGPPNSAPLNTTPADPPGLLINRCKVPPPSFSINLPPSANGATQWLAQSPKARLTPPDGGGAVILGSLFLRRFRSRRGWGSRLFPSIFPRTSFLACSLEAAGSPSFSSVSKGFALNRRIYLADGIDGNRHDARILINSLSLFLSGRADAATPPLFFLPSTDCFPPLALYLSLERRYLPLTSGANGRQPGIDTPWSRNLCVVPLRNSVDAAGCTLSACFFHEMDLLRYVIRSMVLPSVIPQTSRTHLMIELQAWIVRS